MRAQLLKIGWVRLSEADDEEEAEGREKQIVHIADTSMKYIAVMRLYE